MALHRAASSKKEEDLRALPNIIGEYIDEIDKKEGQWGETALIRAAAHGNAQACEYLINAGADMNIGRTKDGMTALMIAVSNGHKRVANVLIRKGADISVKDKRGKTAEYHMPHRQSDMSARESIPSREEAESMATAPKSDEQERHNSYKSHSSSENEEQDEHNNDESMNSDIELAVALSLSDNGPASQAQRSKNNKKKSNNRKVQQQSTGSCSMKRCIVAFICCLLLVVIVIAVWYFFFDAYGLEML